MNEDPSRATHRALLAPLFLALFAALASPAAAQDKLPPSQPGSDATGESNPRASGIRITGYLLYGDRAPDFTLPALDGGTIHLREFRDRAPVALLFLEKPEAAVATYRQVADSLRADNTWLLIVSHQRLPRTAPPGAGRLVLYDRLGEVARMYGAMDVVTEDLVPSLFLIDESGRVRYIAIGALPSPDALLATARGVLDVPPATTAP
jgi:peroxiredoxin